MTRVKRISKEDVDKYEAAKARSQSGKPPPPFVQTPPRLEIFTDTLDITHVYITHVDRFPAAFKQRIFTVPVILNVAIALFLVWRGWYIVPTYLDMLTSILGYISPANVDTASSTWKHLAWIGLKRGLNFMLDFVLLTVILPWPISFFLEQPGNPTSWRFSIGFQNEEIVVRESRKWGTEELMRGVKTGEDSPFFKTRIMPAIDKRYIREKTGYMMMDKNWDLDFYAMTQAHKLIKDKKMQTKDFEKTIWAHHATLGWLYWPVYKMDEAGAEEEQRKKIVELKDKLTAMGKESLFFRWIEIVQYETSRPGEFSVQRQNETLAKVKAAFDEQGVNFEELIKEVGGLEGTPGMEGR